MGALLKNDPPNCENKENFHFNLFNPLVIMSISFEFKLSFKALKFLYLSKSLSQEAGLIDFSVSPSPLGTKLGFELG